MNLWGICQKFYLAGAPLFYFHEFMICIQRHDVVRSSANQVGCLRGLGAITNKSTGGSCLDTYIACQFVKSMMFELTIYAKYCQQYKIVY